MILYLGYDGAHVLSKKPLLKLWDANGGNHYLAPRTGKCLDVGDGSVIFGTLGLKLWDVVKLDIRVPKQTPKKRRKK